MTLRDQVWDAALRQVYNTGKFKIADLPFDESQRHTVRRALKSMEKHGWLERESERAAIWRLGPRAELILKVNDEVREAARA